MTTITMSEWLQAMESALASRPTGDDGMTLRELAGALGVAQGTMDKRLRNLHEAGLLTCGHAMRVARDGRRARVPVYRLKA